MLKFSLRFSIFLIIINLFLTISNAIEKNVTDIRSRQFEKGISVYGDGENTQIYIGTPNRRNRQQTQFENDMFDRRYGHLINAKKTGTSNHRHFNNTPIETTIADEIKISTSDHRHLSSTRQNTEIERGTSHHRHLNNTPIEKSIADDRQNTEIEKGIFEQQNVGNRNVKEGEFYFLIAILYMKSVYPVITNKLVCSGSLISPLYILTTASCISEYRPQELNVRGGSLYWNIGRFISSVRNILIHQNFSSTPLTFNAAILVLPNTGYENDLQKTTLMRVINLRQRNKNHKFQHPNRIGIEAGWGTINNETEPLNQLKEKQIQIIPFNECKKILKNQLFENQFCGTALFNDSICISDSGGPLINNYGILIGMLSDGDSCKGKENPAIYTSISSLSEWISNVPQIIEAKSRRQFRVHFNKPPARISRRN